MKVSRWGGLLGWACLPGLLLLWGCRRETPSTFDRNLPPETYISRAPAESSLAYYRVHLFWNGEDPDGLIDHYEYSVTDSNKVPGEDTPGFAGFYRTTRTDSLFALKADNPQILGHRFYVRAVDSEGKFDPTPAWTYFVAHNYNFPGVTFRRSLARWTDRSGNLREITLRSNDRFGASDTVGIGAVIDFAWDGFDPDQGGYVTGYQYRSSSDVGFLGGTLADTTFSRSFAPTLVGGRLRYFSGREMLQVRSVDDAGAKTQPDSVRSLIVNFNPVTWIVDPDQPEPRRSQVFRVRSTGAVYPSGTTLADGTRAVEFSFTGFDDHRDLRVNPGSDWDISGYSYRRLFNYGGPAYDSLYVEFTKWVPWPGINNFSNARVQNLTSGSWLYLLRCRDQLNRWGAPDSLVVNINYFPFFVSSTYFDADGVEQPLWTPRPSGQPQDTLAVTIPRNPDGTYPPLRVRFLARDTHALPPDQDPLDFNRVVEAEVGWVAEYRARLNAAPGGFEVVPRDQPGERLFPVGTGGSGAVRAGLNELDIAARDNSGRVTTLIVRFRVTLTQ